MEKNKSFDVLRQDFPDISEEYLKKIVGYPQKVSALYTKVGIENLMKICIENPMNIDFSKTNFLQKGSKAVRIRVDGEITPIEPVNGTDFGLQEMYQLLEVELIQPLYLINDKVMIVDEEGALKSDRQINWIAFWVFADSVLRGEAIYAPYPIYGNVLLINDNEFK